MKKVLSIVLALMFIVASFAAITAFAADYTNYLEVKLSDRTIEQAQVSAVLDGFLFTPGETYTATTVFQAKKIVPFGGHAYVACYSYKAYDPASYEGLGIWKDFAVVASGSQRWTEISHEWVADAPTDKVLLNIGFFKAVGTLSVASLNVKDAAGNIVWEADFTKPLGNEWLVNESLEYQVVGASEATSDPTKAPEPTKAPAVGEKSYTAPKGTPVIDGEIDDIWNSAEWTAVDRPNSSSEPNTGSTLNVKLLWDDNKLYFLASVHDTDHNKENDVFEIYLDQRNDKRVMFGKDDMQTRFMIAGGVIQNSGTNCQNDAPNVSKQNGDDFILEGAVDWPLDDAVAVGQKMGLEFMYNDGGEKSDFLTALRWNVDTENGDAGAFADTSNWGTLILGDAAVVKAPVTLNGEPSAWAKEEILKALEADLVPAHVNSNYTTDITRSDFCDLIIKMIEKKSSKAIADVVASYADAKADVSFPDTDSANVIAAAKLGIVNGRSSGAFDPTANITRQEAAKMLALAAKVLGADITAADVEFADAADIYAWAKEFINYVNGIGVMKGTSSETPPNFSPLRTYTREQSILTVYRLFNAI